MRRVDKIARDMNLTGEQGKYMGNVLGQAMFRGFQLGLNVDSKQLEGADTVDAITSELVSAQYDWLMEDITE